MLIDFQKVTRTKKLGRIMAGTKGYLRRGDCFYEGYEYFNSRRTNDC